MRTLAAILTITSLLHWAPIADGQTFQRRNQDQGQAQQSTEAVMDGKFAMQVVEQLCEYGPRVSDSDAMRLQQEFLIEHFEKLGATVKQQKFPIRHPVNGAPVELCNLIVQWHPEARERLLICCHYDTRPYPDKDPENPRGVFLGANDGASGVGLLCELGTHMDDIEGPFGVDFIFFDAEEFVYDKNDQLFVGSEYFARNYITAPPEYKYRAGVLIDMIGDKELELYYERNSWDAARGITKDIWQIAKNMGIKEFHPSVRHTIRDDHLPLNQIARIPTCDIIDFDFPNKASKNAYWHTTEDTPDKCSAESMAKVGNVLYQWLKYVETER